MLTVATLRQRWTAEISGLDGWTASTFPFELLGSTPDACAHLAFGVGVTRSEAAGGTQQPEGVWSRTTVVVRFTARLKAKAALEAFDEALVAADTLRARLLSDWDPTQEVIWASEERALVGEFYRFDCTFSVYHRQPAA